MRRNFYSLPRLERYDLTMVNILLDIRKLRPVYSYSILHVSVVLVHLQPFLDVCVVQFADHLI